MPLKLCSRLAQESDYPRRVVSHSEEVVELHSQ